MALGTGVADIHISLYYDGYSVAHHEGQGGEFLQGRGKQQLGVSSRTVHDGCFDNHGQPQPYGAATPWPRGHQLGEKLVWLQRASSREQHLLGEPQLYVFRRLLDLRLERLCGRDLRNRDHSFITHLVFGRCGPTAEGSWREPERGGMETFREEIRSLGASENPAQSGVQGTLQPQTGVKVPFSHSFRIQTPATSWSAGSGRRGGINRNLLPPSTQVHIFVMRIGVDIFV